MADHITSADTRRHIEDSRIKPRRPTDQTTPEQGTLNEKNPRELRNEFDNLTPAEKDALRAPPPLEDLDNPFTDYLKLLERGDSVIHGVPR